MGKKKSKDATTDPIQSLFTADNPFRRQPPPPKSETPPKRKPDDVIPTPLTNPDAVIQPIPIKNPKLTNPSPSPPPKPKNKRKRDELEVQYEKKLYGIDDEEYEQKEKKFASVSVGAKRKAADSVAAAATSETGEKEESFDDESKLVRTVFVGNLPLKIKKKVVGKEFERFGEVESVRIRSVPLADANESKISRKGAVITGKINEAVDRVHAYIVFKDEQSARASLSHNMAQIGGNHIRVDMACPPRKKMKGEQLYDRKRTVFVGNLPFDVKDEELYQLFCGLNQSESGLEAVRVIRDPQTSLGKGIAYVLFKTRDAANSVVKRKDLKIRDRALRVCHAKADATPTKRRDAKADATPTTKRKDFGPQKDVPRKKFAATSSEKSPGKNDKPKPAAASLSYQGLRASKSGVVKKSNLHSHSAGQANRGTKRAGGAEPKTDKSKRPSVAARKAKAKLLKKRKLESGTPENTHRSKKPRQK